MKLATILLTLTLSGCSILAPGVHDVDPETRTITVGLDAISDENKAALEEMGLTVKTIDTRQIAIDKRLDEIRDGIEEVAAAGNPLVEYGLAGVIALLLGPPAARGGRGLIGQIVKRKAKKDPRKKS